MTIDSTSSNISPDQSSGEIDFAQSSKLSVLFVPWLIVLLVIVLLGVLSPLRDVAAGALLAVGAVAFLPFVIIAGILFIILMSVGATLFGGSVIADDAGIIYHTARNTPRFYRWLLHKDRTWLWGAMLGAITGSALLGVILMLYVIPREATTAVTLIEVGERMQRVHKEQGAFPQPDPDQTLQWEQLYLAEDQGKKSGVIKDAFGRRIIVEVQSLDRINILEFDILGNNGALSLPGSFEELTLTSRGFGPFLESDDIVHTVISENSKYFKSDTILKALGARMIDKGKASLSNRMDALKELRKRKPD